jgi:hypothetical protein
VRKRDIAREELVRRYRAAMVKGELKSLDPQIKLVVDELRRMNGGRLPKPSGGRPKDSHNRLSIWLAVRDAVDAGAPVGKALKDAAKARKCSASYATAIWYDRSEEWTRLKDAEISRRRRPRRGPEELL